jgi:hypothetical protein
MAGHEIVLFHFGGVEGFTRKTTGYRPAPSEACRSVRVSRW